jgi:hypothetical protein
MKDRLISVLAVAASHPIHIHADNDTIKQARLMMNRVKDRVYTYDLSEYDNPPRYVIYHLLIENREDV